MSSHLPRTPLQHALAFHLSRNQQSSQGKRAENKGQTTLKSDDDQCQKHKLFITKGEKGCIIDLGILLTVCKTA